VITQNIDDLLERAGCTSVLHVHGSILEMKCVACGTTWVHGTADWDCEVDRCQCGSRKGVKPGVIMFGEDAPNYRPMYAAFRSLKADDCLVVIGTTGEVIDIGYIAKAAPCATILANRDPSTKQWMPGAPCVEDSQFNTVIHGPVEDRVAELDRAVCEALGAQTIYPLEGDA
jgi:NAD-dependent deacetylase